MISRRWIHSLILTIVPAIASAHCYEFPDDSFANASPAEVAALTFKANAPKRPHSLLVIGKFHRLHDRALPSYRDYYELIEKYQSVDPETKLRPQSVEYHFPGTFGFKGHIFLNDRFEEIETDDLDASVHVVFDNGGFATSLPKVEELVIGTLRETVSDAGIRLHIRSNMCQFYKPITQAERDAVFACVSDGRCTASEP